MTHAIGIERASVAIKSKLWEARDRADEIPFEEIATAAISAYLSAPSGDAGEVVPVAWLLTHKTDGETRLQYKPPADLPFNRERWFWVPLFASPQSLTPSEDIVSRLRTPHTLDIRDIVQVRALLDLCAVERTEAANLITTLERQLATAREALDKYDLALANREHGGLAAHRCVDDLRAALTPGVSDAE